LISGHLWAQAKTWDPEGLLSTLPAAATLLLGALAGRFLLTRRMDGGRTLLLAAAGLLAVGLGVLLDRFFMPINK
jgi:predicted acyltransferase